MTKFNQCTKVKALDPISDTSTLDGDASSSNEKKAMTKLNQCTKVKALDPLSDTSTLDGDASSSNEDLVPNPVGRNSSNEIRRVRLSKPTQSYKIGTLNCRSLTKTSTRKELNRLMSEYDNIVLCIQEHHYVYGLNNPEIVSLNLGESTLFTSTTLRNNQGASIHGF